MTLSPPPGADGVRLDRPWIGLWSRLVAEAEAFDREASRAAANAAERRSEANLVYARIQTLRALSTPPKDDDR